MSRSRLLVLLLALVCLSVPTHAQRSLRVLLRGSTNVDISVPPPPDTTVYGPRASVTCPSGAFDIAVGANIQAVLDAHPAGSTYCFDAGVHRMQQFSLESGDRLYGRFGAILFFP